MSCPHAKKQRIGYEKPYDICLNPKVKKCKCWGESECPLKTMPIPGNTTLEKKETSRNLEAVQGVMDFAEDDFASEAADLPF